MTTEEKAKAYDEAKARMSAAYNSNRCTIGFMNEIFPELAESDDEKIRKEIITFLDDVWYLGKDANFDKWDKADCSNWLAWLKKQGEQKLIDNITPQEAMDIAVAKCFDEHKSTDKVGSKFHEGEWIVENTDASTWLITKVFTTEEKVTAYNMINQEGRTLTIGSHNIDYRYHFWTIKDAKDGDVLATDSWLYIFKYTNNKVLIQFYCSCPIDGKPYKWSFSPDDSYLDIYIGANIHPATKEQCDLLFQKMKEAGYEWSAEKKELKKIEQNTAYWSEEDERYLSSCITKIEIDIQKWEGHGKTMIDGDKEIISWLKSIKDRIQPQNPTVTYDLCKAVVKSTIDLLDEFRTKCNENKL